MDRRAWSALLLCIAVLLKLLGPIEAALESLLMAAGLAGWTAFSGGGMHVVRLAPMARRWLPALAGFFLLMRIEDPAGSLAALALIVLATPSAHRSAAAGCVVAIAAWRALVPILPGAWSIPVALSHVLSSALGSVLPSPSAAGPTATGLWLFLIWLAAVCAMRSGGARAGVLRCMAGFCLVCLNAATLSMTTVAPAALLMAHHEPGAGAQGAVLSLFLRGPLLLLALCALFPRPATPGFPQPGYADLWSAMRKRAIPIAGCAALAAMLFAVGAPGGARREGEIVVRASDAFDMQAPAPERYGIANAGMFGMLPRYLALAGHRVRVAQPPLDAAALKIAAVAVVILPTERLAAAEKAAIYAFVERGGSLLVMGDHTDLLSTRAPIDDLTSRFGLRIRFDSAFPAREQWAACLAGVGSFSPPGFGTGASLEIRGSALPILTAPCAFSDAGDRANIGQGAGTGDRRWTSSEPVGDLVLAAAAYSGRGRVVLFGDTSIFQNVMLPWSWDSVDRLFDDLARDRSAQWAFVALAALSALALALMALRGNGWASAALAIAVLGHAVAGPLAAKPPRLHGEGARRIALIDDAHLNRSARHLWRDRSLGGLMVSLQRAGWIPIVSGSGSAREMPRGSLGVLIEPRVPLSSAETTRLSRHLETGGTLLIAASGHAGAALGGLLEPRGIRIHGVPLGPVPVRGDLDAAAFAQTLAQPQFRDAWPVTGPPGTRSHFNAFGHDIVVDAPLEGTSAGRLIVLGDPDFLTDRVLENETTAWPGNVAFLERLLTVREGT